MAVNLNLEPAHQLERLGPGQLPGTTRWRVTGEDPHFSMTFGAAAGPDAGWHLFDLELAPQRRPLLMPVIYPNYGAGFHEHTRIGLPLVRIGPRHYRALVRLVSDVSALRFDPDIMPCEFELGRASLTRVGKIRAMAIMLRGVVSRRAGGRAKVQTLLEVAHAIVTDGLRSAISHLYAEYSGETGQHTSTEYDRWVWQCDKTVPAADEHLALHYKPLISVIVPVYNTPERWLRRCIESVQAQAYPNWELCLADDASSDPTVRRVLEELSAADHRIKVVYRQSNGHISETSNSAIALATGEYLALLDHDDELHPAALLEVARALNRHPDWRVIFSDEDKIDESGRRYDPYFKPDWNNELFLSHNCISHLGVYQTAMVHELGGFAKGMEGSQDWDLALRCIERLDAGQIGHIPRILYHWRAIPGSTALGPSEKSYAHHAAMRAIAAHLDRCGIAAEVLELPKYPGNYRVQYKLPAKVPKVSIVIPTRDRVDLLRTCVDSLLDLTTYRDFELLIVDNGSVEAATKAYLASVSDHPRVRILAYPHAFNYSAINNFAVSECSGDVVALLNNDIEVITPNWLEEMVSHALRPGVGAVGAMLYYPDDTIQHAGVILGFNGIGVHAYAGKPRGWVGQMLRAKLIQSMSAVTAACMVVRKSVYLEVGGLDEQLAVAYNDIDFCLRLKAAGYRNVWTPYAELYHHESATRGSDDAPETQSRFRAEVSLMEQRWSSVIRRDPAYNVNLATMGEPFSLSFPPRQDD